VGHAASAGHRSCQQSECVSVCGCGWVFEGGEEGRAGEGVEMMDRSEMTEARRQIMCGLMLISSPPCWHSMMTAAAAACCCCSVLCCARCHVCGLMLMSSPHLARSYHHLLAVWNTVQQTTHETPAVSAMLCCAMPCCAVRCHVCGLMLVSTPPPSPLPPHR
jgi:hypothetical protein